MYQPLYGTDPDVIGFSQPSSTHILGTDFMGRDVFSQLCRGAFTALWGGVWWSILGTVTLVVVAYVLAQLREETPQLEDILLTRYVRFIAFPLGVIGLISIFSFLLGAALGRLSWMNILFLAGIFGFIGLIGWLAIGHELEVRFRRGDTIPFQLLLSSAALIISYVVIYHSVLDFFGLGDPSIVSWGMMIQWCFTSGYTFKAPYWLIPPMICTYFLSRGMLALSYGMYNTISEKYFLIKGWL
jgi:peptide/nickel transport system permease protein